MSGKRKNSNTPNAGSEQETIENMKLENSKLQSDLSEAKLKYKKVNSAMKLLLTNLRASSLGQKSEIRNILSTVQLRRSQGHVSTQTDFTSEGSTDPGKVGQSATDLYVNSNGLRYPIKRQFLPQSVVNKMDEDVTEVIINGNCPSQVDSNLCHIASMVIEMTNQDADFAKLVFNPNHNFFDHLPSIEDVFGSVAEHFENGIADSTEPSDDMKIENLETDKFSEDGEDMVQYRSDIESKSDSGSEWNAESDCASESE